MSPTIRRLNLARVNLKGQFNPPSYADTRIDVFAYLVITASEVLLIDTGVGMGNQYVDRTFEPHRTAIADALARFGVAPSDVTIVVNSHLHFDHCGNNSVFANARTFIQESELEVARTTSYTVRDWFDYPGARISPVAGDKQITDGITLIATPGHTPGHQSVLVETDEGLAVIAAQAAYSADEFLRGGDPEVQAHEGFEVPYKQSIDRIKSIGAQRVYFSHDPDGEDL